MPKKTGAKERFHACVHWIALALRQVEGGTSVDGAATVAKVCRILGVTEVTFYRGKKKFAGLQSCRVAELQSCAA
jgi:hypothetical protein